MPIERKFTALKDLKMVDEGSGVIEGYRSVHSVVDEGGDLIIPGAFKDTLTEFLSSGFSAHSHEWGFADAIGFPVDAYEDEHGLFVRSQFHSTDDAQKVRTKAKERMEAGKTVGFSFGYAPKSYAYIEAKDYEAELPKYVKADALPAMLEKAQRFNRIRLLKSVEMIEDSIVTAPMNKRATATAVKSNDGRDELHVFVHAEPEQEIKVETVTNNLKGSTVSDSFESFDDVVAALEKHTNNMQRNHENRTKEGRILSASNRAKVQAARDALDALLVVSEPPPKEKQIDVMALRTQSLRMQSLAIRALA